MLNTNLFLLRELGQESIQVQVIQLAQTISVWKSQNIYRNVCFLQNNREIAALRQLLLYCGIQSSNRVPQFSKMTSYCSKSLNSTAHALFKERFPSKILERLWKYSLKIWAQWIKLDFVEKVSFLLRHGITKILGTIFDPLQSSQSMWFHVK